MGNKIQRVAVEKEVVFVNNNNKDNNSKNVDMSMKARRKTGGTTRGKEGMENERMVPRLKQLPFVRL